MNLQALLGDFPIQRFVAEYFHRLPYSASAAAEEICSSGTWETLVAVLNDSSSDCLVCRRNERFAGQPPRTADNASQLVADGYTLLIRHAERHDPGLARLAEEFAKDFAAPVNIHMYCTPGGQYGFGWHYDAEEVFIIQTTGRKEYSLRKNTVNPWPIEESLPSDMRYEREIMPLMKCELSAGDWLYIPGGYWHMGNSHETSISLAIGVQPHTAVEVFDYLRPPILDSIFWRQRLPVAGAATNLTTDELYQQYANIFEQLGQDLKKQLSDPKVVTAFLAQLTGSGQQSRAAKQQARPTS